MTHQPARDDALVWISGVAIVGAVAVVIATFVWLCKLIEGNAG